MSSGDSGLGRSHGAPCTAWLTLGREGPPGRAARPARGRPQEPFPEARRLLAPPAPPTPSLCSPPSAPGRAEARIPAPDEARPTAKRLQACICGEAGSGGRGGGHTVGGRPSPSLRHEGPETVRGGVAPAVA